VIPCPWYVIGRPDPWSAGRDPAALVLALVLEPAIAGR